LSIGSSKVNITSGDINASNSLIDTYVVILKSRTTLEKAIKEGELPFTYEQLRSKVSGSSEGNTPVFKITVTDEDPEMAANVCNRIVEIMIDQNSGISGIVEGSSVSVIDYAVVARSASSPSYTKNTAIGMLLGFVIACGIVILRSLMDSTIREEEFLLDKYKDIPVLATIPDLLEASQSNYYGYGGYGGSYSKSYAQASANARRPGNATSDISSDGSSKQDKESEV
jgi:capsular polysaccharide biosynthesis protein